MDYLEALKQHVEQLTRAELAEFRDWFLEYDAERWDGEIEEDVASGRLDAIADKALREHDSGRSTPL